MSDPADQEGLVQLLPFYLNGTLRADQRAMLEVALAVSPDLRAELEQQRQLMELVRAGANQWASETKPTVPRIEPEVLARQPAATVPPPASRRSALAFLSPANWSPMVSLALAAIALGQSTVLLVQHGTIGRLREINYELAGGKDPEGRKGAIVVELKDDAGWSAIVKLLGDEQLTIVSGGDFGTLYLGSEKKGPDLLRQIERLRKSPLVASADPAA